MAPTDLPPHAWAKRAILFLLLLSTALYAPVLRHDFIWDSKAVILEDPSIRDFGQLPGFFTTSSRLGGDAQPEEGRELVYYRPLARTYHLLEYALFGTRAWGYKATNLLLNAGVVVLAFLLVLQVSGRLAVAGLAGLLFAMHPSHTEAVCWVHSDTDLAGAAFVLGALLAYARGRRGWSLVLFGLGLLFRETIIVFPLVLALFEGLVAGGRRLRDFRWAAAALAVALVFLVVRAAVIGGQVPLSSLPLTTLANSIAGIVSRFTKLLAWPDGPVSLYMYEPGRFDSLSGEVVIGWLVLLAWIAAVFLLLWRKAHVPAFWGLWFLLWPAASYNVGQLGDYLLAEKYIYLASVGPAALIAGLAIRCPWPRAAAGGLVVLATAHAVVTVSRLPHWKDTTTYLQGLVAFEPGFAVGWYSLGNAYREDKRFALATDAYERTLALHPGLDFVQAALATTWFDRGMQAVEGQDYDAARTAFEQATSHDPRHATAWTNLGNVHLLRKNHAQARAAYEQALRIRPGDPLPRHNLGLVLEAEGDLTGALRELRAYARMVNVVPAHVQEKIRKLEAALERK